MNLKQLKAQAKLRKIPKYWGMNKSQLIQVLEDETEDNVSNILDETEDNVSKIFLKKLKKNVSNILDEPIPEINVPIMKLVGKFS